MISDGWHDVGNGEQVYTENGIILNAVKLDHNGSQVSAWIYRTNNKTGALIEKIMLNTLLLNAQICTL